MTNLDEGEAEAIVLTLEERADLILLDDYEARRVARNFGLSITGTIGILIKAKYVGKIENLRSEIEKLMNTGFWIDENLVKRILRESREM